MSAVTGKLKVVSPFFVSAQKALITFEPLSTLINARPSPEDGMVNFTSSPTLYCFLSELKDNNVAPEFPFGDSPAQAGQSM